jgi:hypothetical protein
MKRLVVTVALVAGAFMAPGAAPAAATTGAVEVKVATSSLTSASGCRTVDVARVGKDIFGFVVYKFHQVKKWCWSYPRITSKDVWTYVSDVDPNMEYRGVVSAIGYYYTWCCSNGYSGHYSLRVGKFENCILWFPCTRTEYPWVKIWARGDGSYKYDTGL